MPKKKEPTGAPVTKESKTPTKVEKPVAAPSAVKSAAETAKPAEAAKPAAAKPAETTTKAPEKPVAPAPAPTAKTPEKPAAPAPAKAAKPAATPAKPAAPAPAAKTVKKPAASAKAAAPVTVIVAKYDVGIGNSMFIRGEGAGLSWESGTAMENAGNDVWVWTTNAVREGAVSFKFLINDEAWSTGDNMTASAGETTTLRPSF
jgi:outer membrane biosynthesis protein TonB